MINLSGEPSLSTLVLTKSGDIKYTYVLPAGMSFPPDTSASLVLTDLTGEQYASSPHSGYTNANSTAITWDVGSEDLDHVPAGANFEVFVSYGGATYKVRYGRVVRKEVDNPLNPDGALPSGDYVYTDDMQRSMPGPRWINKYGRISMQDRGASADPRWAMSSRNTIDIFGAGLLWESASALWYAPLESDTIEINVGLLDGSVGNCTIIFCSNYSMTSFLGVSFVDDVSDPDSIQVVTGSGWNSMATVGSSTSISAIPNDGGVYKITYSLDSDQVKVYLPGAATPALTTTISTTVPHGPGYRYAGAVFQGSFVSTGPRIFSWDISDV